LHELMTGGGAGLADGFSGVTIGTSYAQRFTGWIAH
jgi:hypothetical protein